MNYLLDCSVYYSMIGEHFNIYDRNTDPNIFRTNALIHINAQKAVPAGYDEDEEAEEEIVTGLYIPHEVKGGPFFSSDTQCIIVNGKNQILKLGGRYRLDVQMYRSLNEPDLFSIIFKDKQPYCRQQWISF